MQAPESWKDSATQIYAQDALQIDGEIVTLCGPSASRLETNVSLCRPIKTIRLPFSGKTCPHVR